MSSFLRKHRPFKQGGVRGNCAAGSPKKDSGTGGWGTRRFLTLPPSKVFSTSSAISCMNFLTQTAKKDYETYLEIREDLQEPLRTAGLELETVKELYLSKLVYLETIRVACFTQMNRHKDSFFCQDDYQYILNAHNKTRRHLKEVVLLTLNQSLSQASKLQTN
ncbi:MAG: hypothetical protein KA436_09840 [Oligoflexales bacterium]|nr:hypothetical protein [Oligoflexales bacterium]